MRVVYTEEALSDLENILSFVAERNTIAASSIAERIHHAVETIALFPQAARLIRSGKAREYVVAGLPLLIVYEVKSNHIEVIAVFHTSRNPYTKRPH